MLQKAGRWTPATIRVLGEDRPALQKGYRRIKRRIDKETKRWTDEEVCSAKQTSGEAVFQSWRQTFIILLEVTSAKILHSKRSNQSKHSKHSNNSNHSKRSMRLIGYSVHRSTQWIQSSCWVDWSTRWRTRSCPRRERTLVQNHAWGKWRLTIW